MCFPAGQDRRHQQEQAVAAASAWLTYMFVYDRGVDPKVLSPSIIDPRRRVH